MIRRNFNKLKHLNKDKIAWRSHEVTRIEAFSDAVFAFAVSLLIISLEVPKTSKELLASLIGLIPFALCFNVLFWIWRAQNKFFRRYGLNDTLTLALNGLLLLIVLGYVYPLKFVFSASLIPSTFVIAPEDFAPLVMLYCGGHSLISFLFALMYYNALLKKDAIHLTPAEAFETVNTMWSFSIPGIISVLALIFAYTQRHNGTNAVYSFMTFALLGIIMPIFDRMRNKSFKKKFGNIPMKIQDHNPEG